MHWVLQNGFFSETGWTTLVSTLERFGIDYSVHRVVSKVGELTPCPTLKHKNVICFGSYSIRHVANEQGWFPGVFDFLTQDFEQQRSHWGNHLLNCDAVVCPLENAQFTEEQMYVRPIQDSKHFSGRVFTAYEFTTWQRSICNPLVDRATSLTPKTQILLARPVPIYAEYRFWVVKGELVTQSLYKRGKQIVYASDVDERFFQFVKQRIEEWAPHETFVIDVCDTPHGMKIVEINTLNSSGFYAADIPCLVLALEAAYTR